MAKREIKFLLTGLLFCVPVLAILVFPVWVLYAAGELTPDATIVSRDASSIGSFVVGVAYTNPICYLDLHLDIAKNPTVLVLGSSRVQQFRSTFFDPGVNVFTAPTCVQKIGHLAQFLQDIPANENPKVLIIGLDQKFFDPNYDNLSPDNINDLLTQPTPALDALSKWSEVYRDYWKGKFSIASLIHPSSSLIGLSAITYDAGFRQDGSYDLGGSTVYATGDNTLSLVETGTDGFEYSNAVSQGALGVLDSILAEAKSRNIYVIGFLPPFAPTVYQALVSMPDQYGYLAPLPADVGAIFKKYGFGFYNFTDPASVGITQTEMQDGVHSTERGSLLMFEQMVKTNPMLSQYASYARVKNALASTTAEKNIF